MVKVTCEHWLRRRSVPFRLKCIKWLWPDPLPYHKWTHAEKFNEKMIISWWLILYFVLFSFVCYFSRPLHLFFHRVHLCICNICLDHSGHCGNIIRLQFYLCIAVRMQWILAGIPAQTMHCASKEYVEFAPSCAFVAGTFPDAHTHAHKLVIR